jgi:transposase
MAKSHKPYPLEFRRRMVELVRSGKIPQELSRQFEPSAHAIGNWVRQFDRDEGRSSDGLTTDEREELNRLRREDRGAARREGNLEKAAAWFAQETGSKPSRRSSS